MKNILIIVFVIIISFGLLLSSLKKLVEEDFGMGVTLLFVILFIWVLTIRQVKKK